MRKEGNYGKERETKLRKGKIEFKKKGFEGGLNRGIYGCCCQ